MFSRAEISLVGDIARRSGLTESRSSQAQILLSLLLTVLAQASVVAIPFVFGEVVDALSADGIALALWLIAALFAARLFNRLAVNLKDLLFDWATFSLIAQLYRDSFRHALALPYKFYVEGSSGAVAKAWDRGAKSARSTVDALIYRFIPMTLTAIFALIMVAITFDSLLTIIIAISIAAYIGYVGWGVQAVRRHLKDANGFEDDVHRVAVDSFANILSVKLFNGYDASEDRMMSGLAGYRKSNIRVSISSAIVGSGGALIVSATIAIVLTLSFFDVRAGELTNGNFVTLFALLTQLFMPVSGIGRAYRDIKSSLIAFEKLQELLLINREPIDRSETAQDLSTQTIHFDRVGFRYGDKQALEDISFTIAPQKKVALVGPSGSGKSTVAKLLLRLNLPDAGQILPAPLEGSVGAWRQNFGMVSQDTALLNDTLRNNIAFGADVDDAGITQAIAQARLDKLVADLPDGLDTVIGERGVKLSGGEAQRLAIARALVRKPNILVFDEATSSLDSAVEREIQENIDAVSAGRTSLVIAHRLSTIVDADEILVIDRGRIVERGEHSALLDLGGLYAQLWHAQSTADQPDDHQLVSSQPEEKYLEKEPTRPRILAAG